MPDLEQALAAVDRWVDDGIVPGAAVAVARDDVVLAERYAGKTAAGTGSPVGPETLYSVASITKVVTATALMRLVEFGACGLDESAARWLPEFARDGKSDVTLRDLTCHISGLPKDDPAELELWAQQASFSELAASAMAMPLERAPNTRVVYSNVAYWVLGAVIERIASLPFIEAVRALVLEPAGLEGLQIAPPEREYGRIARRYGRTKIVNAPYGRSLGSPAGGLFVTARDLARFASRFVPGGGVLSSGVLTTMMADQTGGLSGGIDGLHTWANCPWGIGWELRGAKQPHWTGELTSPLTVCHIGQGGALLWFDPSTRLAVAILANRDISTGWATEPARWGRLSAAIVAAVSALPGAEPPGCGHKPC